uniref:Uncharacterized protein n=1 Tax=viral metagenome TaxID=1070528 RepID=A0A6C0JE55_9ZZZZ
MFFVLSSIISSIIGLSLYGIYFFCIIEGYTRLGFSIIDLSIIISFSYYYRFKHQTVKHSIYSYTIILLTIIQLMLQYFPVKLIELNLVEFKLYYIKVPEFIIVCFKILLIVFYRKIYTNIFTTIILSNSLASDILKTIILSPISFIPSIKYKRPHFIRFKFVIFEKLVYFIFGTFLSNYILVKAFTEKKIFDEFYFVKKYNEYLHFTLIIVTFITSTVGYHQSFNAMIVAITNPDWPIYVNILVNLSIQSLSSVIQSIIGYYTNFIDTLTTKEKDKLIIQNISKDFENLTLLKSIILGYKLNSLGDSVYSIAWGSILSKLKASKVTLIWSSICKESVMMTTTIISTLIKIYIAKSKDKDKNISEKNIMIYEILTVINISIISINTFISICLLKKYTKTEDVFEEDDKPDVKKTYILNILLLFLIITISLIYIIPGIINSPPLLNIYEMSILMSICNVLIISQFVYEIK